MFLIHEKYSPKSLDEAYLDFPFPYQPYKVFHLKYQWWKQAPDFILPYIFALYSPSTSLKAVLFIFLKGFVKPNATIMEKIIPIRRAINNEIANISNPEEIALFILSTGECNNNAPIIFSPV